MALVTNHIAFKILNNTLKFSHLTAITLAFILFSQNTAKAISLGAPLSPKSESTANSGSDSSGDASGNSSDNSSAGSADSSSSEEFSESNTRALPGGRVLHRSGESAAKNAAWFQAEMRLRAHSSFKDPRSPRIFGSSDQVYLLPVPGPSDPATLRVLETEFTARVAAYGYAHRGAYADLIAKIPLRTLSSNKDPASNGSELAGFEFGIEGAPISGIIFRSIYSDRQSSRFQLIDKHRAIINSVRYQSYESTPAAISLGVKFGPEHTFVLPQDNSLMMKYGNNLALGADIFMDFRSRGYIFTRLGIATEMRRMQKHEILGLAQGGAGLLSISPYFEFPLLDILWIGLRVDLPVFRPVDREFSFGSLSHPALFGTSYSLSLQAMNF